jgi:patatin-like phospholipase/acyl hydrolase
LTAVAIPLSLKRTPKTKPLRRNLALAIDGGGIRGAIVAKALAVVEEAENISFAKRGRLFAGTSTGSILSAGFSVGLLANRMHELCRQLAGEVFPTARSAAAAVDLAAMLAWV